MKHPPNAPRPEPDRSSDVSGGLLDADVLRAHSRQNHIHTLALISAMAALLGVPVLLIWGISGLIVVAVLIGLMFVAARQTPPEMVMRIYRARRITEHSGAQLPSIMQVLSERAGLSAVPSLYVIPSLTLNAFATGTRDRAAVAVTEGLLRKLSMKELAAVLAHEVSHINNNDLAVMSIADITSRLVQAMSYCAVVLLIANALSIIVDGEATISWLAVVILYFSPAVSSVLQLGLSRTREYDADLEAAQLIGNPAWLASALLRLERYTGRFWEDFAFPIPGRRVPQPSLLRTHPLTADRVARLEALDVHSRVPPILIREEPFVSMVDAGLIAMRPRHRLLGIWY